NSIEQIEFKNINFKYDDTHVLNNFNLSLPKGQFVALVGPSGSGKSTIANLLPRFYDVDSGQILLNGLDIRDINLNYLRNAIGLVQQDVFIFSTSAYENIKYGNPDASMEDIIQASKLANAHEFISDLPDGYHTLLGEKGAKLSGGQKQRISIARMFLKNPEIVIFDEATSALDNFSEQLVQQSLEQLSQNRTTIVIAHRLTTIQNADIICVITKNGIVESGTHSELMNKDGLYKKMYLQNTSK
ncbi:ATP-binding cassette domain-containing protein, partial [Mammaliicoccus fleurettii]|nr:ATP-binding cassette domain-containing protein [Mammaliicoccus fleurettii]